MSFEGVSNRVPGVGLNDGQLSGILEVVPGKTHVALCSDGVPDPTDCIDTRTLAQKLREASVELEIDFSNAINNLFLRKDQLPQELSMLLDSFLPAGECDGSIYHNGFLDALAIVLDYLGNSYNAILAEINSVMAQIHASKMHDKGEIIYHQDQSPSICCSGCGVLKTVGCDCLFF